MITLCRARAARCSAHQYCRIDPRHCLFRQTTGPMNPTIQADWATITGLCAPGALGSSSGAMNNRPWLRDPGTGPFPEASSHRRSCGSLKIASSLLKWRPNSFSNQKIRSPYKNLQTHAKSFPLLPSCGFLDEKIGKGYRGFFFNSNFSKTHIPSPIFTNS